MPLSKMKPGDEHDVVGLTHFRFVSVGLNRVSRAAKYIFGN